MARVTQIGTRRGCIARYTPRHVDLQIHTSNAPHIDRARHARSDHCRLARLSNVEASSCRRLRFHKEEEGEPWQRRRRRNSNVSVQVMIIDTGANTTSESCVSGVARCPDRHPPQPIPRHRRRAINRSRLTTGRRERAPVASRMRPGIRWISGHSGRVPKNR